MQSSMRVFLYEYVTGGGFLSEWGRPPVTLVREGAAMATALAEDFVAVKGVDLVMLRDSRLRETLRLPGDVVDVKSDEQELATFQRLATTSEWTLVIAPEISNRLLERCWLVDKLGGQLLGPPPEFVQLASDKHATAEHLAAAGVCVPEGCALRSGECLPSGFSYPAVLKPRWGAGSLAVRLIEGISEDGEPPEEIECPSRIERFCPGVPASVAFLCGPPAAGPSTTQFALPPCRQRLNPEDGFTYLGGSLPLEKPLAERARKLAQRALASLPPALGYIGIDLVLGADPSGANDVVIEINPRVTTSYVGLRAAADRDTNLAAALLAVCQGQEPRLSFRDVNIDFDCDGTVRQSPA